MWNPETAWKGVFVMWRTSSTILRPYQRLWMSVYSQQAHLPTPTLAIRPSHQIDGRHMRMWPLALKNIGDLALVLFNEDHVLGRRYLRGLELAYLIHRMVKRASCYNRSRLLFLWECDILRPSPSSCWCSSYWLWPYCGYRIFTEIGLDLWLSGRFSYAT